MGTSGPPAPMVDRPLALPAREAYRLWAATYQSETAVSALDALAVRELSPPVAGKALLDAGCGTGRRLPRPGPDGPRRVVGVDLVAEMLHVARRDGQPHLTLMAADVHQLPFVPGSFDVVWCRLVLGHVRDLGPIYREFARVTRPGGRIVITDLHAAAVSANHARTFRDADGSLHAVETHVHRREDHEHAAGLAGVTLETWKEWRVGPEIRRFYEASDALPRYQEQRGLPLLLGLRFTT